VALQHVHSVNLCVQISEVWLTDFLLYISIELVLLFNEHITFNEFKVTFLDHFIENSSFQKKKKIIIIIINTKIQKLKDLRVHFAALWLYYKVPYRCEPQTHLSLRGVADLARVNLTVADRVVT